jgi:hypothetical protein
VKRFSRLFRPVNWTYAIGEVLLIVIGVSIALAVNAWNERRLEGITEREYLCRLYEDFSNDVGRLDRFSMRLERKAETLQDLLIESDDALLSRGAVELARDLGRSDTVSLTWIRTATFDDLQSTGNLALIRNADLRAALSDYFRRYELMYEILDEPVGSYKRILAGAMPGPAVFARRTADTPMERSDLALGLQTLRTHPDFEPAVNAELSYTAGLVQYTRDFRDEAEGLAMLLRTEIAGANSESRISSKCATE